jgi:hypothetical protein
MQIGFGTYFELQSHNKGVVQFVFGYYVTPMTIGIFHVGGDLVVMLLSNVKDECCFSTLFIMNFKFRN